MPGSNNQRHCSPVQTSLTPVNPWSDRTYVHHASVQDKDSLEWSSNAPKSKCPVQITSDIVPCPSITNLWPLNSPTNENVCMLLKFVREQSHLAYASIKSYQKQLLSQVIKYACCKPVDSWKHDNVTGASIRYNTNFHACQTTSMLVRLNLPNHERPHSSWDKSAPTKRHPLEYSFLCIVPL